MFGSFPTTECAKVGKTQQEKLYQKFLLLVFQ